MLEYGLDTLGDLPDIEALEGLLSKEKLLAGDIPAALPSRDGDGEKGRVEALALIDQSVLMRIPTIVPLPELYDQGE